MKNKMKDSEAKFEEWWEVIKEYFTKKLEKNLVQHKVDERILKYKLETYQKKFLDFICGSPTSTKVTGRDEKIEVGPNGIAQEEEVWTKESQDFKMEQLKMRRYNQRYHRTLKEGVRKKKNQKKFRNRKR